jgi:TnpA family transposase
LGRLVTPETDVSAGYINVPTSRKFGVGRGVTWYNLLSNQFSGLNDITVPGTLRDSLILLAVVLELKENQSLRFDCRPQ